MNDLQRTDDWFADRLGKVTASRIADVMARTKTGFGAGRKNYMAQLIAERLTGEPPQSFTNAAMQHGIDTEPEAIAAYELLTDRDVEAVGFVDHPEIAMAGASPDGLVGPEGLIEVKCPNTATHIDTLRKKAIPGNYMKQMQWQMDCTGRKWCDFVSYDPRMPIDMRMVIQRVEYDEAAVEVMRIAVIDFLEELNETIQELEAQYS